MKFHIDQKYIDEGLITEKEHPSEPFLIYNYTQKCQFARAWDEVTVQCRGLIVHKETREIIARPFKKFFNYEEHIEEESKLPKIPNEKPFVFDKRDGSLGILYWDTQGQPWIATRGSFTSDQAVWATAFFRDRLEKSQLPKSAFNKELTHLFEIIYPENQIVVNYGSYHGLDFLGAVHTESGSSMTCHFTSKAPDQRFEMFGNQAMPIEFTSFEELKKLNTQNKEGFVLFFPESDMRVKIKFEDYVRLHKIMTGLSEIGIWEMLRDGKDIVTIMEDVPDEMHSWLVDVSMRLLEKYQDIERVATQWELRAKELGTRKEQAEVIKNAPQPGIVFSMLDGKDYSLAIWRLVRPSGQKTFKVDIDA